MLQEVEDAGPAPWRLHEVGREETGDGQAEVREGPPHEHQRQHEVRGRDADVVEDGEQVVDDRAWMHGRIDASRDGDDPGDGECEQREDHGQHEPLADQLGVGTLVLQREAEVAGQEVLHPPEILNPDRPVEARGATQVVRKSPGGAWTIANTVTEKRKRRTGSRARRFRTYRVNSYSLVRRVEPPPHPPGPTTAYLRTMEYELTRYVLKRL